MKINGRKVLKAKGGADASQTNFKTPSSMPTATGNPFSAGYTGAQNTSKNITSNNTNNNTNNNTTTPNKTIGKIPVIGPVTAGLRLVQNLMTPKKQAHPFSANTIKQTKTKKQTVTNQNDDSPSLCPDGTYPPCKTPETQIKSPAQKTMFLSGFKSYDDGGEVVISANVDKDLL